VQLPLNLKRQRRNSRSVNILNICEVTDVRELRPMSEKLQKMLAAAGYGSRRELERWISYGRVSVNGKVAKLGDRASADDTVFVDGKPARLAASEHGWRFRHPLFPW